VGCAGVIHFPEREQALETAKIFRNVFLEISRQQDVATDLGNSGGDFLSLLFIGRLV
jgi:hypothetical protein